MSVREFLHDPVGKTVTVIATGLLILLGLYVGHTILEGAKNASPVPDQAINATIENSEAALDISSQGFDWIDLLESIAFYAGIPAAAFWLVYKVLEWA